MDESKYYAFVMMMAEHMPHATEAHRALRERVLERLAEAVDVEHRVRARCRDTSAEAATRVRAWRD